MQGYTRMVCITKAYLNHSQSHHENNTTPSEIYYAHKTLVPDPSLS